MANALKRWIGIAVSVVGLGLILDLTLTPTVGSETHRFLTCLMCGQFGLSDDIGNVALFALPAVGLYLAGVPARKTIALLFVLSGAIELAQLVIAGRESSLADVMTNTLGAAAGAGLARWLPKRPRTALGGFLAAAGVLGLFGVIGYAFRPSFPKRLYYVVWTPGPRDYALERGRVLSAEVGGLPLDSGRVSNPGAVRKRILAGEPLQATMIAERPRPGSVPRLELFDNEGQQLVELAEDKHPGRRGDILLHVRLHAADLHLRQPDLRWVAALAATAEGDTFNVSFRRRSHSYCISFDGRERCDFGYTLGRAWGLLQFVPHTPARTEAALGALFMVFVGICFGVFVRRDIAGCAAVSIVIAAAIVLPALMGLASTPILQVAGLAAGGAAGLFVPLSQPLTASPPVCARRANSPAQPSRRDADRG